MAKASSLHVIIVAVALPVSCLSMSACGTDALDLEDAGQSGDSGTSRSDTSSDVDFFDGAHSDTRPGDADLPDGDSRSDAEAQGDAPDAASPDTADADAEDVTPTEPREPGRVTIRRLNRLEYNNTVRDLLGTALRPADDFPEDDLGYGFDNNGDVLSTSLLHAEFYLAAAEQLVEEAIGRPDDRTVSLTLEAELIGSDVGGASGSAWNLWSEGEITTVVEFPRDGTYTIGADAFGTAAAGVAPRMLILIDGLQVADVWVNATAGSIDHFERDRWVEAGSHAISVAFINDYYDADLGEDRNLLVDRIMVAGPVEAPVENPNRDRWITCVPAVDGDDACTASILENFATLAWRRPATSDEVESLRALAQTALELGDDIETGIEVAFTAVLVSPYFLYRPEFAPDPTSTDAHALSDHALASRLSYFLWASMPDSVLLDLAERGALNNPAEIDRQVRRMLRDSRAWGFVEGFAAQWLPIRALDGISPDYAFFPLFDESLRASMRREMELFAWHVLLEDLPIEEFLTADYTFVDARLAALYGIDETTLEADALPSPATDGLTGWYRVDAAANRSGVLGQAGTLAALSYPTRTSPVKRGKWIMTNLLCQTPAPPPPGVESIDSNEDLDGLPIRQRMEIHREDPACYACHVVMDPLGFGLEHFDAIGAWRDEDSGAPVDASGELPDGRTFYGGAELADVVAADPEYLDCFTRQVSTWALGRGPTRFDAPVRADILAAFERTPRRLSDLLSLVAQSPSFTMRTPEASE